MECTVDLGAEGTPAPRGRGMMLLAPPLGEAHLTLKKVPGSPTPMKRVDITPGQAWASSAWDGVEWRWKGYEATFAIIDPSACPNPPN